LVVGTATSEGRGEGIRRRGGHEHGDQAGGREAAVCSMGGLRGVRTPTQAAQARLVEVRVQCHERGHEDHDHDQVCALQGQTQHIIALMVAKAD
jgi:hypothetical protein